MFVGLLVCYGQELTSVQVNQVNAGSLKAAIADGYIPVLTCMAESSEGQVLNVNADKAAAMLAREIVPLKIVYLSEKGAFTTRRPTS